MELELELNYHIIFMTRKGFASLPLSIEENYFSNGLLDDCGKVLQKMLYKNRLDL